MMKFNAGLLYSALALSFPASGHAQIPTAVPSQSSDPLAACEAPSDEAYRLGFGDQISIVVNDNDPKLSSKQTVGPDGRISISLSGSIEVAGSTREEAAAMIQAALLKNYNPPLTVVVGVDVYTSDYVTVMGAVDHQGPMPFTEPPTLLSVISRAGTGASAASGGIVGTSGVVPDRVALFCGQTVAWEDFKLLLEQDDPNIRKPLKRNITVYVPSPNDRYVIIFGEVVRPGMVQLHNGATVTQMLAEAGGIVTDKAGRLPKIQVIHDYKGSIETVSYEDILQAKNENKVALQTGDIIYVPESKASRAAVTFEKISPLISIATISTLITHP
jgi:polysaccharide export outer membrane protein